MASFVNIPRSVWAKLDKKEETSFTKKQLEQLVALDDVLANEDIDEVYLPLIQYISLLIQNKKNGERIRASFLPDWQQTHPYIIGISGSVAVGKSTTARLLQLLFQRLYPKQKVQLMTTDGFLYPNAQLKQKQLFERKGFPESYNMQLLFNFLTDVVGGKDPVYYPIYSQELSDIVPGKYEKITHPDILIIEGINTLQLPPYGNVVTSDFFDFSLYIDAAEKDIETWFMSRFEHLLEINKNNPDNFFYAWAQKPRAQAIEMAEETWQMVNLVNLRQYIAPTKERANLVLHKTSNHRIDQIQVRTY